jgi:V/A-type H+-transporting ATPase subunit K
MTTITLIMTLAVVALIAAGLYLQWRPAGHFNSTPRWAKALGGANLLLFFGGLALLMLSGLGDALAQTAGESSTREVSVGYGLALLGIGLPTGLATIGAGIAVSAVGAASLAVITEKPEVFGRTLVYLGLAEGIAIYGLVVTILLLGKL